MGRAVVLACNIHKIVFARLAPRFCCPCIGRSLFEFVCNPSNFAAIVFALLGNGRTGNDVVAERTNSRMYFS